MNNKIIDVIREVHEQWKGGSGSGNFGHAGRPGKHGGSAPGGGKGAGSGATAQPTAPVADANKGGTSGKMSVYQKVRQSMSADNAQAGMYDIDEALGISEPQRGGQMSGVNQVTRSLIKGDFSKQQEQAASAMEKAGFTKTGTNGWNSYWERGKLKGTISTNLSYEGKGKARKQISKTTLSVTGPSSY